MDAVKEFSSIQELEDSMVCSGLWIDYMEYPYEIKRHGSNKSVGTVTSKSGKLVVTMARVLPKYTP